MSKQPYFQILHQYICLQEDQIDKVASLQNFVAQFLQADNLGVLIASQRYDELVPCFGTFLPDVFFQITHVILAQLSFEERLVYLGQRVFYPDDSGIREEAASLNASTYMRLPIHYQGQLIGIIVAASQDSHQWQSEHMAFGQTLVNMIETIVEGGVIAYRNTALDALQDASYKMAQLINDVVHLSVVLEQIAEEAARLVGAKGSEILLIAPDYSLQTAAEFGYILQLKDTIQVNLVEGLVGQIVSKKQPLLIEDYQTYEFRMDDRLLIEQVGSVIGIPLISRQDLLGVLIVFRLKDDDTINFADDDLDILERLAPLAAMAIEKAQLRDAVRQERSQLHAILDHVRVPIMLFDRQGKLLLANPEAHNVGRRLGLSLYSFIGQPFSDVTKQLPPDINLENVTAVEDALEIDLGKGGEFVIRVAELPSVSGDIDGYVVVGQEVTEERALNRSRRELLHVLSHDLGNVLSQALGYTDLMLDAATDPGTLPLYTRHVYDALMRGKSLIRDVVEIEYAETKGVQIARPYNIETVLNHIIAGLIVVAELKSQTLKLEVKHKPHAELIGNMPLVRQALENLVSNAIKYTLEGGTVTVTLDADDSTAFITVTDTGIGIPPEALSKIWDRFYRVESKQTESIPGTGLGLNLVRSVIEAHNGEVSVESTLGKGSTFRVTLPY